jgi:hypothetical protein
MAWDKIDAAEEKILRASGALPRDYTPMTEIGWRLVRLRAQSIADGAKFLTEHEFDEKLTRLRH